jgi:hypothetical protein
MRFWFSTIKFVGVKLGGDDYGRTVEADFG